MLKASLAEASRQIFFNAIQEKRGSDTFKQNTDQHHFSASVEMEQRTDT